MLVNLQSAETAECNSELTENCMCSEWLRCVDMIVCVAKRL